MQFRTLKSKLLVTVSALVITSGLLISLVATHRYSSSLSEVMTAQAKKQAHAVALEAADKILINDRVALQKMLDHQMSSNPSLAYLFIQRDMKVLAHTFPTGVPVGLIAANQLADLNEGHSQRIVTTDGEHYLDLAWPILGGNAGAIRLGLSVKPYRQRLIGLWLQMILITLAILLLALTVTIFFVRKVTSPLAALAEATNSIVKGKLDVRVKVQGEDELGSLASSFNLMVGRLDDYVRRVEEQTAELERAHHQTRALCGIVSEIGALSTLGEIGSHLLRAFERILKCDQMALLFFSDDRELLFVSREKDFKTLRNHEVRETVDTVLQHLRGSKFISKPVLKVPFFSDSFQRAARQAIVTFEHQNQPVGALVIPCPGRCRCSGEEIDSVRFMLNQAAGVIKRAILHAEEIDDVQGRLESSAEFCGIVGKDPKMQVIYKLIEDVAPTDASVLIQGESGTGKELVARAIHRCSPRKNRPFVVINCSAYPDTLLESELFGHEKGAFTGAIRQKSGRFEQADGGTVFLDEIGEVPLSAQIKLLRVIQTHRFERLGGEKTLSVDVRIIAATNRSLLKEVQKGDFREDLYYRLNVIPMQLPPLKKRPNDIPRLARHFLNRFAEEQGKEVRECSPEAMRLLFEYAWPGNVRELENSIEHATVLAKGSRIEACDLPPALHVFNGASHRSNQPTLVENEKRLLREALEECGWNKRKAAKRLGIGRSTLYDKLKRHQIVRPTAH